jgi:hypothetical protein
MTETTPLSPAPKRRGCLFYGCLTSIVLLLLAGLLVFLGVRFVRNQINSYTEAQPLKMPKVEMADAEFQLLQQRLKSFADALEPGKTLEPLVLSERDLNALIALSANTKALADKVHVSLNGNEVKGMVSIPLSVLGWLGKGRYLNGDATFKVSLENGVLVVTAQEIRVKGRPLPETVMGPLRRENLAKEASQDPKNAEAIRKFESIQVEDSQVTIKAQAVK